MIIIFVFHEIRNELKKGERICLTVARFYQQSEY